MAELNMKGEWKCVSIGHGVVSVAKDGEHLTAKLCVDN